MDQESSDDFDMQLIGSFLSCASRGDKVGLNQMLREGTSPDVQDYDKRTALHLAASEGHASIVELLILYKASVNLEDRWQRTPLTDARLYGHRDICRILEVNGAKDSITDHSLNNLHNSRFSAEIIYFFKPYVQTFAHEQGLNEVNIDLSELNLEHSSPIDQGFYGESEKVKWRGTWVIKTIIQPKISKPEMRLSAKELSLLRELRHPNIVQFLGAIVHGEEMILITEFLSGGNLCNILRKRVRFDVPTSVRYALDIARGMNYLHQHKPNAIVHNNLCTRNLLQDEGGHLKIGEYWVQMLYEQIDPFHENCQRNDNSGSICNSPCQKKKDIEAFASIFYEMLEGRALFSNPNSNRAHPTLNDTVPKFKLSRCTDRIQE
ncbi:serine/threonine-protein kinase VIK-like [Magnolia sinica]|uniref:serine/threonine-protein kinase VIK-like n=1 Tax=Magnolia sinica TaxID=86752 RepID=UPI0026580737|nr:serine/threonine-protein kinase VIK-like [Magnolia sinica]